MNSQHRRTTAQPRRWGTRHTVLAAVAGAVIGAGGYTAIAFGLGADHEPAARATVNETARVLAISDTAVTVQNVNGTVRTYQLTPDTAAITPTGSQSGAARTEFDVNEVVTIAATVTDGTATATAVVDQAVSGGEGPPMETSSP